MRGQTLNERKMVNYLSSIKKKLRSENWGSTISIIYGKNLILLMLDSVLKITLLSQKEKCDSRLLLIYGNKENISGFITQMGFTEHCSTFYGFIYVINF